MKRETVYQVDDVLSLIEGVIDEARKKKKRLPAGYLTRDAGEMRSEIRKHAGKSDDDPSAYTSHPSGGWKADYGKGGKRYKTRKSKWTSKFHKMYESDEINDELDSLAEYFYEGEIIDEAREDVIDETLALGEGLSAKTMKALKNKAKAANAPLGALTTVFRKGMAAWKTGHRPGVAQQQWAMGRVNSFLAGGPARRVDAAQWKRVQKHRKKK